MDARFIGLALRLSEVAGEVLRRHFRKPLGVESKTDNSPVTVADREAEAAMRQLIEAEYPEHGIIGEEYGTVRGDADYQWALDPVDGTRSFLGGYPLFTTLISLVWQNQPVLGVIYQPVLQERWVCGGGQTMLNDKPVRVRECKALVNAVVATTSIDYFTPAQGEAFLKVKKTCAHTVLGGDAYAYAMLASGQMDVVVDAGLKAYDYCALAPIIKSAGGVMTDWQGQPVTLGCDGRVVASVNAQLHADVLALLR